MAEQDMQKIGMAEDDLAMQESRNRRANQAAVFASWLNSMSLRPDANLPAQLQAAQERRASNIRKNRTVNMLEAAGQTELAKQVKSGAITGKTAVAQMFQLAAEERQAQRAAAARAATIQAQREAADLAFERKKEFALFEAGLGNTGTADFKNYQEYIKDMDQPISFREYMDAKSRKPLQNKGTYRYDNRIIGEVTFDPNSGEYFETVNGQRVPIDISKAQPVTDATFAKAIPNYGDFVKLSEGLSEDRTSMDRLQSYMKSIGNTNEGFQRLGDQMTASLKTLLSGIAGPEWTTLSKEELNAAVAQGQLQGLIGRFRIETVGGGVMTEQDALRIIANLGGDVNALQNKEIVAQQIETLFRGKLKSFDSKRKRHDAAIDALYGGMGFDKVDEYEFDESVFNLKGSVSDTKTTMTDEQLLAGAQGKTGTALSQYLQSLSEADFNRLMQLQQ